MDRGIAGEKWEIRCNPPVWSRLVITGFTLGKFLQDNGMKPVHVNPHHVKKSKELDDNNPNKNDRKDPKTIAGSCE